MNIRIIVLDLDGTLLTSQKQISPEDYAALERAAGQGVYIVPSTGRFYKGMPQIVRDLPFVRYVSSVNGAEVYDCIEDKAIHRDELTWEEADEVFSVLETMPVVYDCFQDGWGWMDRRLYDIADQYIPDQRVLNMVHELRTPLDNFRETIRSRKRGVQKIQMFFNDMSVREKAFQILEERFPHLTVTTSIKNNIELNSKNADKGRALQVLCDHLGIDIKDSMAFGDSGNDIAMIKAAGVGVAMENADPKVKEIADFITASNNDNGVAKAIYHFQNTPC